LNATEVIEGRERWCVEHGDALEVLKKLPSSSLDAWVNDPPSGIAFMGRDWDKDKGGAEAWIAWFEELSREVFRVLKPGAHGFVWSLPRTSHWTGTALERAGFEIRDQLHHVFGSGFPKSLNVGRDIVERCEERYGCGSSCTCELDPRVGRAARNDVGRQRREDHRIHVESGSRSQEEARDPNLPIDARRDRSGVRDVWPGDSAQEQRLFCSKACANSAQKKRDSEALRYGPGWKKLRREIRARDRVCRVCAKTPAQNGSALHVHHIKPFRIGGTNHPDNLVALCETCHHLIEAATTQALDSIPIDVSLEGSLLTICLAGQVVSQRSCAPGASGQTEPG
jgi:hypothetical protein